MMHAELLKRLLPEGAYDPNGPVLSVELNAEGNALDSAMQSADNLLREADPRSAYSTLDDWERCFNLPALNLSVEQRQAALSAKVFAHGGQSRPYFIAMAERGGFPGSTIDEFAPATCNSTCNDALYGEPDRFVWRMNLPSGSWGSSAIENLIRTLRPAHTTIIFVNT